MTKGTTVPSVWSTSNWPWVALMIIGFAWVWKPLRDIINEWRLQRRMQQYPHMMALCKSPYKKGGETPRKDGRKAKEDVDIGALVNDWLNRCFLMVVQFTLEVLALLFRKTFGIIMAFVIMIGSLLPTKQECGAHEIHETSQQQETSPHSIIKNGQQFPASDSRTTPSTSVAAQNGQAQNIQSQTVVGSLSRTKTPVTASPTTLHGEAIAVEKHSYIQQPRRLRPLSPSQRLRRISTQPPVKSTENQWLVSQDAPNNHQIVAPGPSILANRVVRIDTSSLSEQMNKRRMNGEEITFGTTGAKKRRLVNGRASLHGCARRPLLRARLNKRVRAEREEIILEGMSRKRSKPSPATTVDPSTAVAPTLPPSQFGTRNHAPVPAAHSKTDLEAPAANPVPFVFGQGDTSAPSSSQISKTAGSVAATGTPFQFGKDTSNPITVGTSAGPEAPTTPFTFGSAVMVPASSTSIETPTAQSTPQPFASGQSNTIVTNPPPAPQNFESSTSFDGQNRGESMTRPLAESSFGTKQSESVVGSNLSPNPSTPLTQPSSMAPNFHALTTSVAQSNTAALSDYSASSYSFNPNEKSNPISSSNQKTSTAPPDSSIAESVSKNASELIAKSNFTSSMDNSFATSSESFSGPIYDSKTASASPMGATNRSRSPPPFTTATSQTPTFGGIDIKGAVPPFGDSSQNDSTALSSAAAPVASTFGGNPQNGSNTTFSTAPSIPGFGGNVQNSSTPTFSTAPSIPSSGGNAQNSSTPTFSTAPSIPSFGGNAQNSSTPTFSTAPSIPSFGGNAQNSSTTGFTTDNPFKAPFTNANNSTGEQKENTNPFSSAGGFSGFGAVGSTPSFGQPEAIKAPPTNSFGFPGSNGVSPVPSTNGIGAANGMPLFSGGGAGFIPGSAVASGGRARSRTSRGRQGRRF
ncbi:hypothetical protein IV203_031787 [Nitzschia inconspicua]|uniref:Uncharacterized protein n=1 Tax=Nitzschia inconspicua TaxID=303405 RepID=A0A9K3Q5E4_9STRA|nr:hypothetical protein IV203_031787 [Nitzschia inconspicua]